MQTNAQGPLLTDGEFFSQKLNLSLPGLEGIPAAAKAGNYALARKLFADRVRASLKPEKMLSERFFRSQPSYGLPGENEREAADRICTNLLVSCGTPFQFGGTIDFFENPTFNKYKEWTWQLSRHHEWKTLGLVYSQTGDEKYAACCARMFTNWVRQAVTPEVGVSGGDTLCWRTIEAGIRMAQTWPQTLHYFINSPHFTDDVITDWYKSVWEHGRRLRHEHRDANWLLMEMEGLAFIGILCPELADAPAWLDYALNMMKKQIGLQFYPDGFQYELTTGYHLVSLNCYLRLLRVAKLYETPLPEGMLEELEKAFVYYTKITMPDGRLPSLNDGSWDKTSRHLAPNRDLLPNKPDLLWFATEGKEGTPPEFTSAALPYSGFMAFRTGWESDSLWALLDAAPFGRGHQHEDKLSLILHCNGKLTLTEGGSYAYDASEMRKYVLSTRSHNTVRVNGQDQNRGINYKWSAEDINKEAGMAFSVGEAYDYAAGEYDEGYGPSAERVASHSRAVVLLKQSPMNAKPFLIVIDRLRSSAENTYEFLWHIDDDLNLDGLTAKAPGLTVLAAGPQLAAEIVCGQEQPEWQGWKVTGNIQGMYAPVNALRYFAKAGSVRVVTVLYPTGVGECPIASVEASSDPSATEITFTLTDGSRFAFDETEYR